MTALPPACGMMKAGIGPVLVTGGVGKGFLRGLPRPRFSETGIRTLNNQWKISTVIHRYLNFQKNNFTLILIHDRKSNYLPQQNFATKMFLI